MTENNVRFCECDWPKKVENGDGDFVCSVCGGYISCDICQSCGYGEKIAKLRTVDYYVCSQEHLDIASDVLADRE